ncbi:MAG TPA: hypothetical protein ENJ56_07905 [Anaerolineae bacterium]|nr:hypothetical protein [Anaerolineae bacterium]
MSKSKLSVVEQRDVIFYDDMLTAVKLNDGGVYAPVRQMCEVLGIDTQGQTQRIRRHDVLVDGLMVCNLHTIQGDRPTNVLRVDLIPFWLSGIRAKAVREEIRPKLQLLQKQAARVLWDAFQNGELSVDETFNELLAQGGEVVEAYKMLQGMLRLAKNQIMIQSQVKDHALRIETIEAELGNPDRFLTQSQAMQISQAVKAIALELGRRSGRNEYGGTYGELYRRFEITSYKRLPAAKFEAAITFLRDWYSGVTNSADVPF